MKTPVVSPKTLVHQELYKFIYAPMKRRLQLNLNNIIEQNQQLQNTQEWRFCYRGQLYFHTDYVGTVATFPIPRLHPDLLSLFREFLTQEHDAKVAQSAIAAYLSEALNVGTNRADLERLLPECLHPVLARSAIPSGYSSLSQDKVNTVLENNAQTIDLIKEQLMLNLLI